MNTEDKGMSHKEGNKHNNKGYVENNASNDEKLNLYKSYKITDDLYEEEKDLRLEKTYETCVTELGLQQSKRDQIIAFYIAICSFVIPAILDKNFDKGTTAGAFFALYILGSMLAKVVVRYRIYKEVYWITVRTITQLYIFKKKEISKKVVQRIFYQTMELNAPSVLDYKKEADQTYKNIKVNTWKSLKKIINSAETILYEVQVLMSSLVLGIGILTICGYEIRGFIITGILVLLNLVYWTSHYYKSLTKVYKAVVIDYDKEDEAFNATFSKAWFLHSFFKA